jgi:uncharacterized protein (TIGR00296 family)
MSFGNQALTAARATLQTFLAEKKIPAVDLAAPEFSQHCGVFVTLKKHGDLRGCIGLIKGIRPLKDALPEMAVAAAVEDPRFPPVTLAELNSISIEISVLSPLQQVKTIDEITIGRDGLLLQKGRNSGLLLPQVAVEWQWNVEEFLHHLCMKAGLPPGSHLTPDAKLYKFTAQIFTEKEI